MSKEQKKPNGLKAGDTLELKDKSEFEGQKIKRIKA